MKTMFIRKLYYITCVLLALIATSCSSLFDENAQKPYDGTTRKLAVKLVYPAGFEDKDKEGIAVSVTNVDNESVYKSTTDALGVAHFEVGYGVYRMAATDKMPEPGGVIINFNGALDGIRITNALAEEAENNYNLNLISSRSGQIIVKEIYSGGCKRTPAEGTYGLDQYIILYNNTNIIGYLDGICFGSLDPLVSTGNNVWAEKDPITGETKFRDHVPIYECVWQFPGTGKDFPLNPGEQIVLALREAIDHNAKFTESVNLNRTETFACYDNQKYPSPPPGVNVGRDHYMECVKKVGRSTSYTIGAQGPNVVIFNVPESEISAKVYFGKADNELSKPGSSDQKALKVPIDWILDAVEVFTKSAANNNKRLAPALDAGTAWVTNTFLRHTSYRNVDIEATLEIEGNEAKIVKGYKYGTDPNDIDAEATLRNGGRIIYMDTNNSSVDFHERSIQSIHPQSMN